VDKSDVDIKEGKIVSSRFLVQPKALKTIPEFVDIVFFLRDFFKTNFTTWKVHHVNPGYIRIGEPVSPS
jgi:hypothetical protein